MQQGGLRRELFFALVLSLVIPGIVAGMSMIYFNLQRTVVTEMHARAEKLADLLQAGMVIPLWEMAPDLGKPLIEAIATDPAVEMIEVSDIQNKRVLSFHHETKSEFDPISVVRPIVRDGEVLGEVRLSYTITAAVNQAKRSALRLSGIVALQLLATLALLGAWLSKRVLKPLETLRRSADRIAGGDLHSKVPALQHDEFGLLSAQLDAMRNSLAQSLSQMEVRVEKRTRELREVNTRLQATLDDLQRMQNRLVQSEKLASLGSLVAGVAHELNTPIGTCVTVISTVTDKCAELRKLVDAGIRRSQLEAILGEIELSGTLAQRNLQRAARLIHDFKQIAVDQTSSRRRKFELHELLRETMLTLGLRHKHAPVTIESKVPTGIEMDSYPGAIEQVLANLIENALTHGAQGRSTCAIDISAAQGESHVMLTVADNGNGIPPENLPKIFDPFFTTRMGQGGSGLGLSIVYGLVTGMLGGHITVDSPPGGGTRFVLELPWSAPERADSEELSDA